MVHIVLNKEKALREYEFRMMSDFSKGLTLWGIDKVVKKWLRYRKASLEAIIYEIGKDVGQRKMLGKGDMLSIFINDIEKIIKTSICIVKRFTNAAIWAILIPI